MPIKPIRHPTIARAQLHDPHLHRLHLHLPANSADQLSDKIATGLGSWRFLIIQSIVVGAWITLNTAAWFYHWDDFPYILLNLLFSTQAAYAAPVILMAQNRQAAKDRARDDVEAHEVNMLFAINQRQLEILEILHKQQSATEVPDAR